jgi:uncharacterized protein DUF6931
MLELSEEAQSILRPDASSAAFVKDLAAAGLFPDALKVLAHSLGGRQCIAWSLACLQELKLSTPKQEVAVAAVEKWLAEPNDDNRRAAQDAAQQAKISTPAGCIAQAVFFSEGSIAPKGANAVPPPAYVGQKIAAGGVLLAVVSEPAKAAERYQRCIAIGLQQQKEQKGTDDFSPSRNSSPPKIA